MCAILDANVANEVFGSILCPAGERFLDWINKGQGRLVVGGKLLSELGKVSQFLRWSQTARLSGVLRTVNQETVIGRTQQLEDQDECYSDDPHVVALAQLSGARLLYSNDTALHLDFKNKNLIDDPRGKVYSTNKSKNFSNAHRRLLGMKDLCKRG